MEVSLTPAVPLSALFVSMLRLHLPPQTYKPLRTELLKEAAERAAAASRVGSAKWVTHPAASTPSAVLL